MESKSDQHKLEQCSTVDNKNPWKVSSIFDFCYFCCPECDDKSKSKQDFVNRASAYHDGVSLNKTRYSLNLECSPIFPSE